MAEVKKTESKDDVKVALGVVVGVDELVERISASVCSKLSLEVEEKAKKETKEEKKGDKFDIKSFLAFAFPAVFIAFFGIRLILLFLK